MINAQEARAQYDRCQQERKFQDDDDLMDILKLIEDSCHSTCEIRCNLTWCDDGGGIIAKLTELGFDVTWEDVYSKEIRICW